jgi:hypothetical protein
MEKQLMVIADNFGNLSFVFVPESEVENFIVASDNAFVLSVENGNVNGDKVCFDLTTKDDKLHCDFSKYLKTK